MDAVTEKVVNNNDYTADKVKEQKQTVKMIVTPNGEKEKIYKEVTYKNGVKKRTLVGIRKAGKLLFDRGVDKKELEK